jgi:hypothetical protein
VATKVLTKLLGLDYKIVYKKCVDNKVADALSRHPLHSSLDSACCAISASRPKWLEDIVNNYSDDAYAQDLIAKLAVNNEVVLEFSLLNGLLRYKGRLWVGDSLEL